MTSLDEELEELKIEERLHSILTRAGKPVLTEVHNGDGKIFTPSLYLLNHSLYEEVVLLDTTVRGVFANRGLKKEKNPFSAFAKIITPPKVLPSLAEPSYKYHIIKKHTYKYIKDQEKIASLLYSTYFPFASAEEKRVEELIKNDDYDEAYKKKIVENSKSFLKQTKEKIEYLVEHYDNYHLALTDYTNYRYSAIIYHTLKSGKHINSYLRNSVPNILYYEADEERSLGRADREIGEIIKNYECVCGKIYFKKKI